MTCCPKGTRWILFRIRIQYQSIIPIEVLLWSLFISLILVLWSHCHLEQRIFSSILLKPCDIFQDTNPYMCHQRMHVSRASNFSALLGCILDCQDFFFADEWGMIRCFVSQKSSTSWWYNKFLQFDEKNQSNLLHPIAEIHDYMTIIWLWLIPHQYKGVQGNSTNQEKTGHCPLLDKLNLNPPILAFSIELVCCPTAKSECFSIEFNHYALQQATNLDLYVHWPHNSSHLLPNVSQENCITGSVTRFGWINIKEIRTTK